jgi:cation transport regulator ChaB
VAGEQLVGEYAGLWRYEFDVQTRWGYYPRHIPNLVATTFAADACLLAASLTSSGLLALARGLLRLFSGSHFTYTPRSGELIHNANLMGASLASRLSLERDLPEELREQLCAAAEKAVNTSVGMQRSDGSWPYGEKSSLQWVDGFHTGYVLIRLDEAAQALGRDLSEALARGSQYYFEHLFDGASPRYFANRGGHEDPTNASTAVVVAAWAARKRLADPSFPDAVLNSILPWFTRRGVLSATLSAPPLWRSPRWSMVPLLDALGAVYGVVDA